MALDQTTRDKISAELTRLEGRRKLTPGTAQTWGGNQGTYSAGRNATPATEVKRLKAKANRLNTAVQEALSLLVDAKTLRDEPRKAQAKITRAIQKLAI